MTAGFQFQVHGSAVIDPLQCRPGFALQNCSKQGLPTRGALSNLAPHFEASYFALELLVHPEVCVT